MLCAVVCKLESDALFELGDCVAGGVFGSNLVTNSIGGTWSSLWLRDEGSPVDTLGSNKPLAPACCELTELLTLGCGLLSVLMLCVC